MGGGINESITEYGPVNGLAPSKRTDSACTNDDPIQWHIYVSSGFNVLN